MVRSRVIKERLVTGIQVVRAYSGGRSAPGSRSGVMVNFAVAGPVWLERRKGYVIKPGFPNANTTSRGVFGILE